MLLAKMQVRCQGKESPTDNKSAGSHERRRGEKELGFYVLVIVKIAPKKFPPAKKAPTDQSSYCYLGRWGQKTWAGHPVATLPRGTEIKIA
jgi:hypothetical protein